jgi:hypothetical protein
MVNNNQNYRTFKLKKHKKGRLPGALFLYES